MIIDNLDIHIIFFLYNLKKGEEINTKYDLIKKLFPEISDYERKKIYTNIKRKLKKLEDYGLIKTNIKGDKVERILQIEKIDFKRIKFKDCYQKNICLKIYDEWRTYKLSY